MRNLPNAKKFERQHLQNIAKLEAIVQEQYHNAIKEVAAYANAVVPKGAVFSLAKFPQLNQKINQTVSRLYENVNFTVINGINLGWATANKKNDADMKDRLGNVKLPASANELFFDPNEKALAAFLDRKTKGLNLSQRVWKRVEPYKYELEKGVGVGISEGKSAAAMARDMKQYLQEPDRLFRRVRNAEGKLELSKAARAYKPGQGVYRSSYQNAIRMTGTETNIAYRTADFERWQSNPMIIGIKIQISNNHPEFDICDICQGMYPKDFKFTGWHPRCRCFAVAEQLNDDDFSKVIGNVLQGKEPSVPPDKMIKDVPENFKKYVADNRERIEGWKNQPYWLKDNKDWVTPIDFRSKTGLTETIRAAKNTHRDSFDLYTDGKGVVIDAERLKLHDEIVNHFVSQETSQLGTIFTTGGAPANGKSTLTEAGVLPHPKKLLKVDPDEIKKMIPEYAQMVKTNDPLAAAFAHEESSYLSKRIIKETLKRNNDFLQDGVGDGSFESLEKKIRSFQATGKRVRSDYVSLDTNLSVKLAEARAKKTGREVPLDYIKEMNSEISKLIPKLIEKGTIDELFLWDTNINGKPRLILSQINGKLTIKDKKLYQRFLSKSNP